MLLQALKVMAYYSDNSAMTESDETTFWERLGEAMLEKNLKHTQTAAGALIGSKGNTAAKKWQDGGYPNMTNAIGIAKKLGVCVEWLLTGRGSKHPIDGPMSGTEGRILAMWRTWTAPVKRYVFSQMRVAHYTPDIVGSDAITDKEVDDMIIDTVTETGKFRILKHKDT